MSDSRIADWFDRRATPICWLTGPSGAGKTAAAKALLAAADPARVLQLSAASPDRCLQQAFANRTTAGLFARLTGEATRLLVLDALDTVQHRDEERAGRVADLRFRHLLAAAAHRRWPGLGILVTSRLPPPLELPGEAVTVIECAAPRPPTAEEPPTPASESGPATVLEILASSRRASSGWLLAWLSGNRKGRRSLATPAAVRKILEQAMRAGLIDRVELGRSGEWFQMPDILRQRFLPPARAAFVHQTIASGLESEELPDSVDLAAKEDAELLHDLLERAMEHRIAAGDWKNAVLCYWNRLGNFSRLAGEHALHLGARACGRLNEDRPPQDVSPALRESPGAFAVLNDWGVHTVCAGDAEGATEATLAAYGMTSEDTAPWDRSTLARHAAEALLLRGRLQDAMYWVERATAHALDGIRRQEGLPTEEVMSAYDHAYDVMISIAAAGRDAEGAAEALSQLVEVHARARKVLAAVNRSGVMALPGPSGEVDAEALLDGRPAARVALLDGRPGEASRILARHLGEGSKVRSGSRQGLTLRTLLLRAQLADGRPREARAALAALRALAAERDDAAARCELAAMAAELDLVEGNAEAALASTEEFLDLAALCDLNLLRNDLLAVRGQAQRALGRVEDARASVEAMATVTAARVPARPHKPRAARAADEPRESGPQRRRQLHEAALAVIEDYNTRGLPFALYFRKYDFLVSHGPMEFGPQLIENLLQQAMPPGVQVLTIQEHQDDPLEYSGSGLFFDRSAPALYLEDAHWQEVAAALISHADLIVSECYMLGKGVRFELDQAYRAGRWDRTVLLLPPLQGPLAVVDNDPAIQMFPRCLWMDSFHQESLADSPVLQDLIARMSEIAALPEDERRQLNNPAARDAAFPIDLLPIAEHYEFNAMWSSQWQDQDERIRYYGFWELFRAASIRGERLLQRGDDSFENRRKLSSAYVQLSAISLDYEKEGDKFVLVGDLTFAEQCAQSALALLRESDGADYPREKAENQLRSVLAVRDALAANPDRLIQRPRYGPFPVRRVPQG